MLQEDVESVLTALPYLRAKFEDFAAGVKARWPAGQDGPLTAPVADAPEPGSGKVSNYVYSNSKLERIFSNF